MKKIFEYTNFRSYLKDFYEFKKKSREGYTFRDFSAQAGMNSSSWLMHLIKGTKNLSNETTLKVAKVLGLTYEESQYFELLVHFTQSKSNDVRDYFYKKMLAFKRTLNIVELRDEQYDYYTKWYHPVVRSLVSKVAFGDNYAQLARKLVPRITAAEAKKSVQLLERLGLIKKDGSGRWVQTAAVVSTGDEVMSLNVVNYHKQVSKLAEGAFDRSSQESRDISALTMGIGKEDFLRIKAKVQAFRKEIMEIAANAENPDRVYQMNFQFFPVSEWESDGHVSAE
jgi:uncharacterized protein (TIGR02147 family)